MKFCILYLEYYSVTNISPKDIKAFKKMHSTSTRLLKKIINIDEECSNGDEQKLSETENMIKNDSDVFDISEKSEDSRSNR